MFNNDVIFDFIVFYVDPASGLPYAINLCLLLRKAKKVEPDNMKDAILTWFIYIVSNDHIKCRTL